MASAWYATKVRLRGRRDYETALTELDNGAAGSQARASRIVFALPSQNGSGGHKPIHGVRVPAATRWRPAPPSECALTDDRSGVEILADEHTDPVPVMSAFPPCACLRCKTPH